MNRSRLSQGSVVTVAAVTTGLLAVLAGCAPAGGPAAEPTPTVSVAAPPAGPNTDSLALLAQVATPPTQLSMPDLGISGMTIESHGLDPLGEMSLPVSPFTAGWYMYGSAPDSIQGATVVAAHVDSLAEGKGPFSRLREASPGMAVTVTDAAGVVHTYRVVSVEKIAKAEVPLDRVFTAVGDPHLVLVTCGGEFDRQADSYKDNYIVTAEKVS